MMTRAREQAQARALAEGRRWWSTRAEQLIIYGVLGTLALAYALPFFLMVSNSLKTPAEIIRIPPALLPTAPSLESYRTVLSSAPYFTWYRNSLLVASSVTLLTLFTSSIAGYIFAKFEFPGKRVLFLLILSTMMVPFTVLLIPTYLIVHRLGLLNTLWALIIPSSVSAFGVFLMRQFIANIPTELIEAARIDGASEFAIYARVIVPLVRPALATLGIFTFLGAWNDYLWPLVVLNDLDKMTLPLALTFFNSTHAQRYDLVMASATMMVGPVFVVFLFFQRYIVRALVMTGLR
jgi:multiple sugar transport system permease protein